MSRNSHAPSGGRMVPTTRPMKMPKPATAPICSRHGANTVPAEAPRHRIVAMVVDRASIHARTPLATPMPLTPADAYQMAKAYFEDWLPKVDRSIRTVELQLGEGGDDAGWRKDAAFMLHQAAERAYICFLLVRTLYFPKSHNIKFLRSLAEGSEPRLIESWPRDTRIDRRRFQLLKRAYVEARYSSAYEITVEELNAILACVRKLRDVVEQVGRERLESLRVDAGLGD